jgi:hypothetical protein
MMACIFIVPIVAAYHVIHNMNARNMVNMHTAYIYRDGLTWRWHIFGMISFFLFQTACDKPNLASIPVALACIVLTVAQTTMVWYELQ